MEKSGIFVVKDSIFQMFGHHLDLDSTLKKIFELVRLGGLSFKKSGLDLDRKL